MKRAAPAIHCGLLFVTACGRHGATEQSGSAAPEVSGVLVETARGKSAPASLEIPPPPPGADRSPDEGLPLSEERDRKTSNGASSAPPPAADPHERPAQGHRALRSAQSVHFGDLRLLTPHRRAAHELRGSGHTHCAPDHSDIDAAEQQRRLAALGPDHRHHFVWMTAHAFVAPDPSVPGIRHLFGVELYTKRLPDRSSPHVVALLPDGSLASAERMPFGLYEFDVAGAAGAIARAGGLAVLAHPSRYAPDLEELGKIGPTLWGIEILSGSTRPEENAKFVDARLSAGQFTCLSAGGDIHDEDYKLTLGYQLVSVSTAEPSANELFQAVAACNFFACGTKSQRHGPIRRPALEVRDGQVRFSAATALRSVRFVGKGGRTLYERGGTTEASYVPRLEDAYVRVEAVSADGHARCYSQPVWLERAGARDEGTQRAHPASESLGSNTNRRAP